MSMEQLKAERNGKRRSLQLRCSAIQRYVAETRELDFIKQKVNELKDTFDDFDAKHQEISVHLQDEGELDEDANKHIEGNDTKVANKEKEEKIKLEAISTQKQVTDLHNLINLPKVELVTFHGDPLNYHAFISLFESSVENHCSDGNARLARLLQYTGGKAKRAIHSCANTGGDVGYNEARRILRQRFGDRHIISEAITSKLRNGKPATKGDDIQALSDELSSCVVTLRELDMLNEVDTQLTIIDIVHRFPRYIQNRWKTTVIDHKTAHILPSTYLSSSCVLSQKRSTTQFTDISTTR